MFLCMKRMAVAAVAVLALGSVAMAQSVATNEHEHEHGHGHASNVRVPLTATGGIAVSNVGMNCTSTDTVTLTSGRVHLLAIPRRDRVRANAADVSGTGATGASYELVGSHDATLAGPIPSDGTVTGTAQFKLLSEDDNCASQPVTANLNLVFSGGVLQSSSTACVAGTTGC
ncbi:MAG TPA: hypothetical protein VGR91_19965 [Stellaceae bacterium]|nr:hypothetical protein [Stellaceae bacterium]